MLSPLQFQTDSVAPTPSSCADMISDRGMIVNTYISVPKEMAGLNCAAFVAGIVEAILAGADFVCRQIIRV